MCFWKRKLTLTHPQEPPNPNQMANADVPATLTKWLTDWQVPPEFWDYWRAAIVVTLRTDIQYPAQTYWGSDGKRHLDIRPEWVNPGVVAHEQAHNSYALLSEGQKAAFSAAYTPLKTSDSLIKFLYSQNAYGLSSDVEGHAEVFRYLQGKIPAALLPFYPKLLEV